MQIGKFRKNVMKTVGTKAAKTSLRLTGKNTLRTNVAHATVALKTDTGHLIQALSPYVKGVQFNQEMKDTAFTVFGDIGYDLTILCRILKVKMPTATKKSKLVGTRTAALLSMDGLTTDMLAVVSKGMFEGPIMTKVTKTVVLPNKGGIKEDRIVDVVDTANELQAEEGRQAELKSLLAGVVDIYWRLCFDVLQQPPHDALMNKFERVKAKFPNVDFDLTEAKPKAEPAPVAAAN